MRQPIETQARSRSIRLRGYDYAQAGAYFVTICSHNRRPVFGEVVDSEMRLNEYGKIVSDCWHDLVNHYPHVELDEFIVMPNHIHGIIVLTDVGEGLKPSPTPRRKRHGLPEIVRALKTFSSRRINALRKTPGTPVWQRNYYEHVVRNEDDLANIRLYVRYNAAKWDEDVYNPQNANASRYDEPIARRDL